MKKRLTLALQQASFALLGLTLATTPVWADHNPSHSEQTTSEYQRPTFTGANKTERLALLEKLSTPGNPSSTEQKRQLLLLKLALFANSADQSLKPLEMITDDLQSYLKSAKSDYEIMAAFGSALSLQSIFYQRNLGKMNFLARKGMRYMDRAVKKSATHLGVRLLRGLSYANMPAFLSRASFAEKDLNLLKTQMKDSDGKFIEFIDYYLAMALVKNKKAEQAKTLWNQLAINKASDWSSKASEQLKDHF
ncbi:MAG: hypothetical protein ACI9FJ_001518 [Alteromonadaceae bacterium]|jgi:hypothetical protein